jgi:hypothetical protein
VLPVRARNLAVGGSFQPTTYQLGTNLYIGNNPAATACRAVDRRGGTWRHEREDAVRLAEAAKGRSLTPAEVSHYWTGRAVSFALHEPGAWLRLMARKTLVWNRVEVGDHESPGLFADVGLPRPSRRLALRRALSAGGTRDRARVRPAVGHGSSARCSALAASVALYVSAGTGTR